MRSKTLWVKEQYLKQIVSGKKTVEVRVAYTNLSGLVPGDVLRLNDQFTYRIVGTGFIQILPLCWLTKTRRLSPPG